MVEDDPALLRAITFLLETEGFRVECHGTAESFERADTRSADCLVIDQRLPDGFGLDVLTRERRRGVGTPAMIITSDPPLAVRLRARALDARLLEKPLLGDELMSAIRSLTTLPPM